MIFIEYKIVKITIERQICRLKPAIFTDVLGIKHEAAKIVPKLQKFLQKQRHIDIVQEMLTTFNDDSQLLENVITDVES